MTIATVAAPPPQQPDLLALADEQAAALLVAELAAADAVSWPLRFALAQIRSQLSARQQLAAAFGRQAPAASGGGTAVRDLQVWTRQQLREVATLFDRPAVAQLLQQTAQSAASTGAANATAHVLHQTAQSATVDAAGETVRAEATKAVLAEVAPPRLEPAVAAVVRTAPTTAAAHLEQAVQALSGARDIADIEQALTVADRAPAALTMAAQWAVNRAAATAVRATAARLGAELLWIAERDACVVCTALAGHTANPAAGEGFDEFATFGPHRPPAPWPPGHPLLAPPRHPHCRCQIVVWLGTAIGQPDLPASLRHEAKRSVLRGFSRPSEPSTIRVAAARELLRAGSADMPKSVRAYAAHAVQRGRFPTREVPRYPSAPRRAA